MIRWKAVIPTLLLLAGLAALTILCLDPAVKWAVVKGGETVFGARVNVRSATVKLRTSSLRVRGLEVADKSSPMQNLFQWDEAVFDARFLPLLEKKVVIDQATVSGLKFGAPRKTSGALARQETKPGVVAKAADRLWSQVEKISLDKLGEAKKFYDPKTLINPAELSTFQVAQEAQQKIEQAPDALRKELDSLNAQKRTEALKTRLQALGEGPRDASNALQKVQEVQAIQKEIKTFQTDLAQSRDRVVSQVQSTQNLVEDVKKAREEDWKKLRSTFSLPTLDKNTIASALFGPTLVRQTERLLGGIHQARRYMPAKAQVPPPPPRGKGRIVEFPRTNVLPRFLLVKAGISGEVGRENPFQFGGQLEGISSNPPLYAKPAVMSVEGSQGPRSFSARAIIDHRREIPLEVLQAHYTGFPLANATFGEEGSLGFRLNKGSGKAEGAMTFQGERLTGRFSLLGYELNVEPRLGIPATSAIGQRLNESLTHSLSQIKHFTVQVAMNGNLSAPGLSIESDIGNIIAGAMKNALGAEIEQQQKALRAELDKLTQAKIQELSGLVQNLQKQYLAPLASQNKVVDELLSQAKKQAAGNFPAPAGVSKELDKLKGLFGH